MKRVRRQNSMWMLGLGFVATQPAVFAGIQKQPQVIAKLPQNLQPLQKSLLFDQTFDKAPLRPFLPETVVAEYLERIEAKNTPAKIAEEIKIAASKIPEPAPIVEAPQSVLAELPAVVIASNDPAPVVVPTKPNPVPVVIERPAKEVLKELEQEAKVTVQRNDVAKLKNLESDRAGVYVLDESAFLESRYETVPQASVQWLHPESNLSSKLNKKGIALVPYPNAYSARYIVKAPGYLPAVGYAVKGMISPVLLYREARLGPILKSLNQGAKPGHALLIGKFLDRNLKPIEKMSFDEFMRETQTSFYSLGLFGLFHPAAKETGSRGDFLINQLNFSLQYLLAKQNVTTEELNEWPAQLVDLKGLEAVLTTTLIEPKKTALSTQLVDSFTLERPETGIYASIGGQRGLIEPDAEGILDLGEVYERPSVDLIEIHAQGYLKTWLNAPAQSEALPDFVPLFTFDQLDEVLKTVDETASLQKSYVIGAVRPENMKGKFELKVYGANGRLAREAQVFYFGKENSLSTQTGAMDPKDARFVVAGLPEGEWHLVLVNTKTGQGQGIQIVRTQRGTISQTQF